jgi:uncharacterized membrane protein
MKRLLYLSSLALVLAGIIHILVIFLIPNYAANDAWTKLGDVTEPWEFSIVSEPGKSSSILPWVDPAFGTAACLYDLDEAPLRVNAVGRLSFWSVAIFDRQGRNIYSFNDRTAVEQELSLIVVNPVQMAQFKKNPPPGSDQAVLVETESGQGFVLIRALQESSSWGPTVRRFLTDATCERMTQ